MSAVDWREEVEELAEWAANDPRALDSLGKVLSEEERRILAAVLSSKGDPKALADVLGPLAVARLRGYGERIPERLRRPATKAWTVLREPLKAAWRPPTKLSTEQLAEAFLRRYSARLDELSDVTDEAAAAAAAAAATLRAVGSTKALVNAGTQLQAEIEALRSAVEACAHEPKDRSALVARAAEAEQRARSFIESVRALQSQITDLAKQVDELTDALRAWSELPPRDRAVRAEAMAQRVQAAYDVTLDLREQFLAAVFATA